MAPFLPPKALLVGGLALALLVLGALGRSWLNAGQGEPSLFPAPPCDLQQGPCEARQGDLWIRLSIVASPISAQAPLPLKIETRGLEADQVAVDFQGVEMFMGLNRYTLQRHADGSYRGEGRLPACTSGSMRWRARVLLTRGEQTTGTWFEFEAAEDT
ncbi:hypothetical protein [Motiliproteus sp. SC1-56]|uniref:hypothetical protein n=1 Tax=Motiliproteus sp. SC1-56 TaxID=2799565 RepID=UPI001A8FE09A|nr:hypothetical protein [Motiliproteus sp. SC1-56]